MHYGQSPWRRVEAGYYQLRGTDIEVINRQGQDVKWSGLQPQPVELVIEGKVWARYATIREAKQAAIRLPADLPSEVDGAGK